VSTEATLLHDPAAERDACGIGFVAEPSGSAARAVVDALLEGLAGVRHRGATASDGKTGDGAGLLLPLRPPLVPAAGLGLAMVFLREEGARTAIEEACRAEGIEPAGWRQVPVEPSALGAEALASAPRIEQLALVPPRGVK
jgi:glutamate synthase (NADPH/NADH) large chain